MKKEAVAKKRRDYVRVFYVVTVILFSVLAVQSASAKLSCSIVYDSADTLCSPDQTVLRIYDNSSTLTKVSDRHVLPYNPPLGIFDYNLKVCCTGDSISRDLTNPYSGGVVLRAYDQDPTLMNYGLHVEQNDQNSFDYTNITFGTRDNSVECINIENSGSITNGGCDSTQGYSCIVKLYQSTNSHAASCDDPAPDATTSVCCRQNVDIPGWNIQGSRRPVVKLVNSPIKYNSKSVKINASESSDYAGIRSDKIINIKSNQVYEASAYVYIPTDSNIVGSWGIEMHVDDDDNCGNNCHHYANTGLGTYNNYTITATSVRGEWVKLVRRIKTDSTPNLKAKVFFITGENGKGSVYVDAFNLVEMNGNENPEDLIPYQNSEYNYGCCKADECWTGVEGGCEDTTVLSTGTPEPNPRCLINATNAIGNTISTSWSIPFKKEHWFNAGTYNLITNLLEPASDQYQYCPLENQCWDAHEGGTSSSATSSYTGTSTCFMQNQSKFDRICDDWETGTKILLANILEIAKARNEKNYTIVCDGGDCYANNMGNPSVCSNSNVTCVYRNTENNTMIIGMLVNNDESVPYVGDSFCGQSEETNNQVRKYLESHIGLSYETSLANEPPTLDGACFNEEGNYFTNANIQLSTKRGLLQSIGWNNLTKEILISNKDIDYNAVLQGKETDFSILSQELGELNYYDNNLNSLPTAMSTSVINLTELFKEDRFYNTVFFHRSGNENITNVIDKEGNAEYYLASFYRSANLNTGICNNITKLYTDYNFNSPAEWSPPLPALTQLATWFNCDLSGGNFDTFALLNNLVKHEMPVYADLSNPMIASQKTFSLRYWTDTTKAFRQFDKCAFDYTYQNASVPPENYTYALTNQYLPFSNPTAEGCCNNNTCWNGFECASNFGSDKVSFGSTDLIGNKFYGNYNAGPEHSFVCRANASKTFGSYEMGYSVWNKVYKKDKWDYSEYGYCLDNTQCWNGTTCMESGSVQEGNYCLGGNWTSMTHIIALTLLNFTETRYGKDANFTFECGDASPLAKFTSASVCNYYSYDKSKWTFAFTLPTDSDPNIGPTGAILDAFGMITVPSDPSTEYDVFQIDPAYSGPIKKLFWDSKLEIAVITNDGDMNAPATHVNFFKRIWYWFTTLIGIKENDSAPEIGKLRDMLQNSENFKELFYMQNNRIIMSNQPMTTIEGLKVDYDSLGNNYTAIIYNNASVAEVCKAVNNTAWQYIQFPQKTNLPKVLNCTNTTTIAGKYNYKIFIVHNSTLIPTVQNHKIDTVLWKDQTYRFENFSSCSNDTYHVTSLPERIRNNIIGPTEYILYNHSSMTSCCFNITSCWTGQFCENEWNMVNYSFVSDENLFVCENGTWTNATRHYDWEDISSEYCAQPTQCYLPSSAYNRENSQNFGANYELQYSNFKDRYLDGRNCTKSNFVFYHDRYCLEGNWTTRTGMLAAELLNFTNKPGITNYSLHCDSYNVTLNTVGYSLGGGHLVSGYLSGQWPAPTGILPTNNFCVLRYKDGEVEKVAVGTSLNNKTTVSEFLETTIAAGLAGACNGDETLIGFADCNSDGKIWFNNRTQTIVYNKDSMALEPYTGMQAFLQFLSNPAKSVMEFIRNIFNNNNKQVPTEIFDYNRYYNINVGNMTVIGYVRNKNIDDRYIVVTYDNTTAFICDSVFRYDNTLNCTGSSGNFNVSGTDYNLMNKIFPDLTAKIRPKR